MGEGKIGFLYGIHGIYKKNIGEIYVEDRVNLEHRVVPLQIILLIVQLSLESIPALLLKILSVTQMLLQEAPFPVPV